MRLIDADALIAWTDNYCVDEKFTVAHFANMVRDMPTAQPEIIRCKDCEHWRERKYLKTTKRYVHFCRFNAIYTEADDYCSKAERRTDE